MYTYIGHENRTFLKVCSSCIWSRKRWTTCQNIQYCFWRKGQN